MNEKFEVYLVQVEVMDQPAQPVSVYSSLEGAVRAAKRAKADITAKVSEDPRKKAWIFAVKGAPQTVVCIYKLGLLP